MSPEGLKITQNSKKQTKKYPAVCHQWVFYSVSYCVIISTITNLFKIHRNSFKPPYLHNYYQYPVQDEWRETDSEQLEWLLDNDSISECTDQEQSSQPLGNILISQPDVSLCLPPVQAETCPVLLVDQGRSWKEAIKLPFWQDGWGRVTWLGEVAQQRPGSNYFKLMVNGFHDKVRGSIVTFTTDLILLNGSLGWTTGSESWLGTVLFILLPCSAQFSSVLIRPHTLLPVSRENQSVMRAAMLSRFRIEHTFSALSSFSTSGERERKSGGWASYFIYFQLFKNEESFFWTALWKERSHSIQLLPKSHNSHH